MLDKLKNNDPAAWKMFYEKYNRRIRWLIKRTISNDHDVDELVNDVFLRIQRYSHNVNKEESLEVYLDTATQSVIIDHLRASNSSRQIKTERIDEMVNEFRDETSEYYQEQAEKMNRILEEVFKRPPQQRKVYLLILKGVKIKDIAKMLRISRWTVYNQKKAVEKHLRKTFGVQAKRYQVPLHTIIKIFF